MKKKIFVAIIILILILLIILSVLISIRINELNNDNTMTNTDETNSITEEVTIETVKDNNLFFTIEYCIQVYETYLHMNYEEQVNELNQPSIAAVYGITSQTEKNNAIINILDGEYVNISGINSENVMSFLGQYTNEVEVKVLEMNRLDSNNTRVNAYSVNAEITNMENQERSNELFIVKLDNVNSTFSIYPLNNAEYNSIDQINVSNTTESIEKNSNNTYIYMEYNDSQIATMYFQDFKDLMIGNPEEAYEKLDEEYRNARFGTVENFIQYVDENKNEIESSQIIQYQSEQYNDYKQYVCQKLDNTYWIIRETSPRNYTVILDIYTIDLPEFIEEYNNADDARKVQLNISKVFEAINNGDYNYVYNKLDETFKQNNFPTLEEFEQYMENTFYDNNSVGYTNYQTSGNLHIYELSITDADNTESTSVTKNFIMQLLDGTNFVMSFNV